MKLTISILGSEVFSIEVSRPMPEPEEEVTGIGGGSGHNFERDVDPLSPDDRYDWPLDDDKFGFR